MRVRIVDGKLSNEQCRGASDSWTCVKLDVEMDNAEVQVRVKLVYCKLLNEQCRGASDSWTCV